MWQIRRRTSTPTTAKRSVSLAIPPGSDTLAHHRQEAPAKEDGEIATFFLRTPVQMSSESDPMTQTQIMKIPGLDHPITIAPHPKHIVVTVAGRTIVDTHKALALREADYPVVIYVPRADADMTLLVRSTHTTHCPYKGDAAYFSLPLAGARGENAIWTYEEPYRAAAAIKDHLAFYSDRVTIEEKSD
jgi:uncharacterized protein (DUF427 family)